MIQPIEKQVMRKLNYLQKQRNKLLDDFKGRIGVSIKDNRVRFSDQDNEGPIPQVAFIAVSVNNPQENNQLGGYSVVWLDKNRENIHGCYNGPFINTIIFSLLAIREVLKVCPQDQPLVIACNNPTITKYVSGEQNISKNNVLLKPCLKDIERGLRARTAFIGSFLFDNNTRIDWVKEFYDLAQDVARTARKDRPQEPEYDCYNPVVNPSIPSPEASSQQEARTLPVEDFSLIMKRLKEIASSRKIILEKLREPAQVYSNRGEEVAVIAMSADSPHPSEDFQVGGYGVVWLNSSIENQFGSHGGKNEQTLNFLIMAVADAILQCPSDRRLLIACKNQLIANYLNNEHPSLSRKNQQLGPYLEIIERTLRTRSKPVRAVLIDPAEKDSLLDTFYELSRLVASEARRLWYTENSSDRSRDSSSPSRLSMDSYRPPPRDERTPLRQYESHVPGRDSSPTRRSRSPPIIKRVKGIDKYLKSLDKLQKDREILSIKYMKIFHPHVGPEEQTAFIAMSSDRVRNSGYQIGGYGVVWLELQQMNHFGHHDGPFTNTSVFILKGIIDALVQSNPTRPLHIGMRSRDVYEFLSGKGELTYKEVLKPYIKEIKDLIAKRPKTVKLFFIGQKDIWNDQFYEIARKVASEARKIRLDDPDQENDPRFPVPTTPPRTQPEPQPEPQPSKQLENKVITISQEERDITSMEDQQQQQQQREVQQVHITDSNMLESSSTNNLDASNSRMLHGYHSERAKMLGLLEPTSVPVEPLPVNTEEHANTQQPHPVENSPQGNVSSLSNASIPIVTSPSSTTPAQVLQPSNYSMEPNPVESHSSSNDTVSVIDNHGESSVNGSMDVMMTDPAILTANDKRPISTVDDHEVVELSSDANKKSRSEKSDKVEQNTEISEKILDFSEWHAATKSMREWLDATLKTFNK